MFLRLQLIILLAVLRLFLPTAGLFAQSTNDSHKSLYRVIAQDIPFFFDDMDIDSLIVSARHQAAYLHRQNPEKVITFGLDRYSNQWLLHSIQALLAKLEQRPDRKELNQFLHKNYLFYQAGGRTGQQDRRMLVTGYYEPVFAGSLIKKPPFLTPLYFPPKSLAVLSYVDGKSKIGRYTQDNKFVSYWTRAEIENSNLLQGCELVYLKDPFDAFLLHVQGSGRIQLPDQSIRSVRFAGSNGLEYKSIGKLLVDENIMTLEEVSVPAIRSYLRRHPEQRQRILQHNPRFIFFNWGDALPPEGSSGEKLTPGRSIAMDTSALPDGTIGYLISRRPRVNGDGHISGWKSFSRFVFPQDSGAAIKGPGRVDIFWGTGEYAELAASHMKEEGKLYFLVKKGYPGIP